MDLLQAIKARHSVRSFLDKEIENNAIVQFNELIGKINTKNGLHFQLLINEPRAFDSILAHYGRFKNVKNYFALVGKDDGSLAEKCGYFGQQLVLFAQQLGLNTCWVAATYSKGKCAAVVDKGEKLAIVIALGYGTTQGVPRKTKSIAQLSQTDGEIPQWFTSAMEAVQLAPTAVNQQKFLFQLKENTVYAKAIRGILTKLDLGIAKYHFEIGAKDTNWQWGN